MINEILNWYFVLSIDKYNTANVMWNWQWFEILRIFDDLHCDCEASNQNNEQRILALH